MLARERSESPFLRRCARTNFPYDFHGAETYSSSALLKYPYDDSLSQLVLNFREKLQIFLFALDFFNGIKILLKVLLKLNEIYGREVVKS
jgi:hypothetical protein